MLTLLPEVEDGLKLAEFLFGEHVTSPAWRFNRRSCGEALLKRGDSPCWARSSERSGKCHSDNETSKFPFGVVGFYHGLPVDREGEELLFRGPVVFQIG